MSNNNGPNGFRLSTRVDGAPVTGGLTTAFFLNSAGAIFYGDPLIISGGFVAQAAVVPGGRQVAGVAINQASWQSKTFNRTIINNYWPGTADAITGSTPSIKIIADPQAFLEVQTAGTSGAALTQAAVGQFFNYNAGGGGNTGNGISGYSLDDATGNTVQGNLPFKLVWIEQQPFTDPTSQFNRVRVGFANLLAGV
jgi:hypothetical protein